MKASQREEQRRFDAVQDALTSDEKINRQMLADKFDISVRFLSNYLAIVRAYDDRMLQLAIMKKIPVARAAEILRTNSVNMEKIEDDIEFGIKMAQLRKKYPELQKEKSRSSHEITLRELQHLLEDEDNLLSNENSELIELCGEIVEKAFEKQIEVMKIEA